MSIASEPPPIMRVSLDDWHRMIETGELAEDDRVELIFGEVFEMEPISAQHQTAVNVLSEHFARVAPAEWVAQPQGPLALRDEVAEPQPDLALVPRDRPADVLPSTALLVVEVAFTSQRIDRELKAPMYARAGIPEYWLVDVLARRVEVRTKPVDGEYWDLRSLGEDDELVPTTVDAPPLRVRDLFA